MIVNSPNNPTGVVYSEEIIQKMADILEKKQSRFRSGGIYLISDEPYRELAYDGVEVPYLTRILQKYDCGIFLQQISFSSGRTSWLSGDSGRGGRLAARFRQQRMLPPEFSGYVNAPSLMQKAVARCLDARGQNVPYYNRNRGNPL